MATWKKEEKESVKVTQPGLLPGSMNRALLRET